jgi:hypothetical protein
VDLRKNSTIRFAAVLSFPVLTFGPFPSPESLSTALGYAIGTFLPYNLLRFCSANYCSIAQDEDFLIYQLIIMLKSSGYNG